jgi:intron-binding protein aquarius
MYPTERLVNDDNVEGTEMTGVEHLGQYVYEMTKAKVKALKESGGMLPEAPIEERYDEEVDGAVIDEDVPEEPEEDEEFV